MKAPREIEAWRNSNLAAGENKSVLSVHDNRKKPVGNILCGNCRKYKDNQEY